MLSPRSTLVLTVFTTAVLMAAGCQANTRATASGSNNAVSAAPTTDPTESAQAGAGGKCRFITAAEMAQAAGVAAVKPVETAGGCSYLLNPADVMPSIDPAAATIPPLPPSVDFFYWTDDTAIGGFTEDVKNPREKPITGLGRPALWYDNDAEQTHELSVRTQHGVVRINVMPPDPPQHLRTDDRTAIAEQIYRIAAPRLG